MLLLVQLHGWGLVGLLLEWLHGRRFVGLLLKLLLCWRWCLHCGLRHLEGQWCLVLHSWGGHRDISWRLRHRQFRLWWTGCCKWRQSRLWGRFERRCLHG